MKNIICILIALALLGCSSAEKKRNKAINSSLMVGPDRYLIACHGGMFHNNVDNAYGCFNTKAQLICSPRHFRYLDLNDNAEPKTSNVTNVNIVVGTNNSVHNPIIFEKRQAKAVIECY